MIRKNKLLELFKNINNLLHSDKFKNQHVISKANFTRKRKLPFHEIIIFILSIPKKSLTSEISKYFEVHALGDYSTKQAFSKARQLISFSAFKHLFSLTTNIFDFNKFPKKWKQFSLFAIDGSTFTIPSNYETQKEFGALHCSSKLSVCPKLSFLYDICNDIILNVHIGSVSCDSNEREHAKLLLDSFSFNEYHYEQSLIIFDRGYPSRDLIYYLNDRNFKFLIRCSSSFLKEVNCAPIGDSLIVDLHNGISTDLRVIKFILNSGQTEMLVTNLFSKDITISDFKNLYFMRWGIETKFNELKNRILIEHFSTTKVNGIKQDIYANLILCNIAALFKNISDHEINNELKTKSLKHGYQTNRSFLLGLLSKKIYLLINFFKPQFIDCILELIFKERSILRPKRKYERSNFRYWKPLHMNTRTNL